MSVCAQAVQLNHHNPVACHQYSEQKGAKENRRTTKTVVLEILGLFL